MTHKLQISKAYPDGTIVVVGGENGKEFRKNWQDFNEALGDLNIELPELTEPVLSEGGQPPAKGGVFKVESISLASGGKNPRWVVKGGNFTKYGVTCWPEVLEKAGILDKLKIDDENTPKGDWTAEYTTKLDGKPDKVVQLVRNE